MTELEIKLLSACREAERHLSKNQLVRALRPIDFQELRASDSALRVSVIPQLREAIKAAEQLLRYDQRVLESD
jgi:hypothetical protein